jgi:hypothetical protein
MLCRRQPHRQEVVSIVLSVRHEKSVRRVEYASRDHPKGAEGGLQRVSETIFAPTRA